MYEKVLKENMINPREFDHIIPLYRFDLTKEQERIKAFHYTNMRPLWKKENAIWINQSL